MRHTLPSLILTIVLLATACSDQRYVAMLDRAESLMLSAPDSSLALLDHIDSHILNKSENARYALLRSQALDKNYIDVTNDSLINIAVDYYDNSSNYRYRGMAYYYKARVCYINGEYEQATKFLIMAEEALLNTTEYNTTALTYVLLSEIYIEQYRLDDAIDLINRSRHYYKLCNNRKNIVYNHLRLSKVLMIEHPADSVVCHLDSARTIALQLNNEELLFMVENYRASFYDYIKEYDLAKATLYTAFKQYPAHTPNANDYHLLSRIYYNTGKLDSALYILDNYYAPLCQTYSDKETLSFFRSTIYNDMADYANAYKHIYEYIRSVTSSGLLQQDKSINELETKYRTELLREKSQSLATRNTLLSVISLLVALVATLFIYLYIRQRQLRKAQYLQLHMAAQQEIDAIQSLYNAIKEQLHTQLSQQQLYKNELENRIDTLRTLTNMTDIYAGNKEKFYDKCRAYINMCNQKEVSFVKDIRTIASLYCEGFVERLQSRYPDLTDEDINLACIILLGFDNNQIRILFNHSHTQSVYNKRRRLRKKLGLDNDIELETFLQTLASNYTIS